MKELLEMFEEMTIENYIDGKPEVELDIILHEFRVIELKDIAYGLMIEGRSKLKKQDLISAIQQKILNKEHVANVLYSLSEKELKELVKISKTNIFKSDMFAAIVYNDLIINGILFPYHYIDEYYLVVPNEIKPIIKEVMDQKFKVKHKRISTIHKYADACVNLYGVIDFFDYLEIFNTYNNIKLEIDELMYTLFEYRRSNVQYEHTFDGFVSKVLYEYEMIDFEAIFDKADTKCRYIPEKEELLKYADLIYLEETKEVNKLGEFLSDTVDEDEVYSIIDCMIRDIRVGVEFKDIIKFMDYDALGYNIDQVRMFTFLVQGVYNNTRMWRLNGNTPEELRNQGYMS